MLRRYFTYLLILLSLNVIANAKTTIDSRIVTGATGECNTYDSKLLHAKEVKYDFNRKKPTVSKALPVPPKKKVKDISVEDSIKKYVKVEDSVRFRDTEETILNKEIHNSIPINPRVEKIISEPLNKKTHTLKSLKNAHTLQRYIGEYTIKRGDSLNKIAAKFHKSKKTLQRLNHLEDGAPVKLGQKFKIPLPQKTIDAICDAKYTVSEGETLLSVAEQFHLNLKDLMQFNHMKSSKNIQKNKTLKLPLPYLLKALEREKKLKVKRLAKQKEQKKHIAILRNSGKRKLRVTATAYTSHRRQTDSTPFIAAWNNHIRPGMKMIAVSRDLISRYGLRNGTKVRIGGLPGHYVVRDKMNKRYRRRIDIYMGMNKRKAYRWGRRSVTIHY